MIIQHLRYKFTVTSAIHSNVIKIILILNHNKKNFFIL